MPLLEVGGVQLWGDECQCPACSGSGRRGHGTCRECDGTGTSLSYTPIKPRPFANEYGIPLIPWEYVRMKVYQQHGVLLTRQAIVQIGTRALAKVKQAASRSDLFAPAARTGISDKVGSRPKVSPSQVCGKHVMDPGPCAARIAL